MIKIFTILLLITVSSSCLSTNCLDVAKRYQKKHGGKVIIVRMADEQYNNELHAINWVNDELYDVAFNIRLQCPYEWQIPELTPVYWGEYQHNLEDRE